MNTVTIQNLKTSYREYGSGDTTIIMLHGWPADSSHYEQVGPLLAEAGYRVIIPDFPGWGGTDSPPKPWTVSDYREWVFEFVQELGIESFVLFGHSFGGRVSIKYAIKYPYQLQSVILCAAAGIKPDPSTLKRRILYITAKAGKKAFTLPVLNRFAPFAKKLLYRAAGSSDYNQARGIMKETIKLVLEEDLSALLPQIALPTLLVWGTEDGATPLEDGKHMHEQIHDSTLEVYNGIRHNIPKLAPKELSKSIDQFLQKDDITTIS